MPATPKTTKKNEFETTQFGYTAYTYCSVYGSRRKEITQRAYISNPKTQGHVIKDINDLGQNITFSKRDWESFGSMFDNPSKPRPVLEDAARKYLKLVTNDHSE